MSIPSISYIIIILMCFQFSPIAAQEPLKPQAYEKTYLIDFDSLTAKEIKVRTDLFIIQKFKDNAKSVVSLDTDDKIIINGLLGGSYYTHYTMQIDIKEGKSRVIYRDVSISGTPNAQGVSMERQMWTKSGKAKKAGHRLAENITKLFGQRVEDYTQFVKGYDSAENKEW